MSQMQEDDEYWYAREWDEIQRRVFRLRLHAMREFNEKFEEIVNRIHEEKHVDSKE